MTARAVAWHNEPSLKSQTIERMREHRAMDRLRQGHFWVSKSGCQLGCLLEDYGSPRIKIEWLFGLPAHLTEVLESVFETLPQQYAGRWAIASLDAIPVGGLYQPFVRRTCDWTEVLYHLRKMPVVDTTESFMNDEVAEALRERHLWRKPVAGELVSPAATRGGADVVRLDDAPVLAGRI